LSESLTEDLNQKAELARFGISCERNSHPEVLGKIYRLIGLLQSLAGDGFSIDAPAIAKQLTSQADAKQLTSQTDAEDWNLLITEPKGGLYAKVFSNTDLLTENSVPMYTLEERELRSAVYERTREDVGDKIGECIELLLEIKHDLHESNVQYSIDADKFANAFAATVPVATA